ncbi:glycosyltransferase family 2 protein [Acidicapsa dinghuensis]|uniref:Glycosyltransferase family 2 protein n=1 Tax=Acidicapsa dinghuensis TaxID=2218256 RepID=A0ABW1ELP2_9BACT|nr:glycosyltransferase family A protein [Acidicapsa dinghuensis]
MNIPAVSIVIPTRGRPDSLLRCVERLDASADYEIIISDDGDADETRRVIDGVGFKAAVVQGPKKGPAANRNFGAAHAVGELLIFLDDDCIPDAGLIDSYLAASFRTPEVSVFEGRISATGRMRGFADVVPENEDGGHLWSCNFAIRRSLFNEIGGFDERFRFAANEDMDLYLRALKFSPVMFLRDARVYHPWERRAGAKPLRHKGFSTLLFMNIYPEGTHLYRSFRLLQVAARTVVYGVPQHIRERALADPVHLFRRIGYDLKLAAIVLFWNWRRTIAPILFQPCCETCHEMMRDVAEPQQEWTTTSKAGLGGGLLDHVR